MLKGLLTKSNAPSRTASTAFSSSPKPVTMMTGVPGVRSRTERKHIDAVEPSVELEVADHQVEGLDAHARQRLLRIERGFDLPVRARQQLLHEPAGARVVVEDQNA